MSPRLVIVGALTASLQQASTAGLASARGAVRGLAILQRPECLRLRGGAEQCGTAVQQFGAERPMSQAFYDVDGTVLTLCSFI